MKVFKETQLAHSYGPNLITKLVLRGTIFIVTSLCIILILHGITSDAIMGNRILVCTTMLLYLLLAELLLRREAFQFAAWMLISLYTVLTFFIFTTWGINTSIGILAAGFIIFLTGFMIGPRSIIPVSIGVVCTMVISQVLYSSGFVSLNLGSHSMPPDYWDILTYVAIFGIFALVSWVAGHQVEKSLVRARNAEAKIRQEKMNLIIQLEKQSVELRQLQLEEMSRLYRFAEIGQSTTATLHELSNHLSILTLDIDDLGQQHQHSGAIANAQDSIRHINQMVSQARKQLKESQTLEKFDAIQQITTVLHDMQPKLHRKSVKLESKVNPRPVYVYGDSLGFSHVISILINNAIDACQTSINPLIQLTVRVEKTKLLITIDDNGPGIPKAKLKNLFHPIKSTKLNGMGVGLYIARHIIHGAKGTIVLQPSHAGASFLITLPLLTKGKK